jgi:hypothetical protein
MRTAEFKQGLDRDCWIMWRIFYRTESKVLEAEDNGEEHASLIKEAKDLTGLWHQEINK